jgi:hypothetical protein
MAASQAASVLAVFGRITWMLLGPVALVLATFGIVNRGEGWVTAPDILYFTILGLMFLGRWLEFRGGNPQTADGQPATPEHLRRYLIVGAGAGLAIWVFANLLGNYGL